MSDKDEIAKEIRKANLKTSQRIENAKAKAMEKVEKIKMQGIAFAKRHTKTLTTLGLVISGLGGSVPLAGGAIRAIGDIFTYAGLMGKEKADEAVLISEYLDILGEKLEEANLLIAQYTDSQKKDSTLMKNVKVIFTAWDFWAKEIKEGKEPTRILESLPRKLDRLDKALITESLRFSILIHQQVVETDKKVDALVLDTDGPDYYYIEAKTLMKEQKYELAIERFLKFQKLVKSGGRPTKFVGKDDHSIYYLYMCWNKKSELPRVIAGDIAVLSCDGTSPEKNPYEKEYRAFRKKYPDIAATIDQVKKKSSSTKTRR